MDLSVPAFFNRYFGHQKPKDIENTKQDTLDCGFKKVSNFHQQKLIQNYSNHIFKIPESLNKKLLFLGSQSKMDCLRNLIDLLSIYPEENIVELKNLLFSFENDELQFKNQKEMVRTEIRFTETGEKNLLSNIDSMAHKITYIYSSNFRLRKKAWL